jgi:hypothetical protein
VTVQSHRSFVARAARLRPADVVSIARALFWMASARVLIRTLDFPRAARLLGLDACPADGAPVMASEMSPKAHRALRVALVTLKPKRLGVSCLPHSVALERVLRASGVTAEIVLGVRHEEGFKAHAWVEVSGAPIGWGEDRSADYVPVGRFRRAR